MDKTFVKLSGLVLAFLVGVIASERAVAAIGQLDSDSEFPYVVQLRMDGSSCTGVVTSDNLVTTAAHCVWDKKSGRLKTSIRIEYTDVHGIKRTANSTAVFIPDTYKSAVQEVSSYLTKDGKYLADPERWWAANMRRAMQDIAFIIPDRAIDIEGYPHWITEILIQPYSNYLDQVRCPDDTDCLYRPTKTQEEALLGILKEQLGSLDDVRAKIVGFGGFDCVEYTIDDDGNDDCRRDGQRRIGEARLVPFMKLDGQPYGVPWVWCTGRNDQDVNPVRRGDSGGPMFVRARDGRWLFTGYLAVGGRWGCSSSLIHNLALWHEVLRSKEYRSMPDERDEAWFTQNAKRAFLETLDILSLPNDEALLRLKSIYGVYNGDGKNEGWNINGEVLNFPEIYDKKKKFFLEWPKRSYWTDDVNVREVVLRPGHQSDHAFYRVRAKVRWKLENPATGSQKTGSSNFKTTFNMNGLHASQLEGHGRGPVIDDESETADVALQSDFVLQDGIDFPGNDLSWIEDASLEDCASDCREDKTCKAFTFNRAQNVCIIKSGVGHAVRYSDAISATVRGINLKSPIAVQFSVKRGVDYLGPDYANRRPVSLDDCKAICAGDDQCRAFTYAEGKQWCFLKSSVGQAQGNKAIVSGTK